MPLRLYCVRHGQSEANLLHEFSNRGLRHPLTDLGRAQVAALADRLAGIPFQACYTSPLLRAVESAAILGARLGLSPIPTPALTEFDVGRYEGTAAADGWAAHQAVMDGWLLEGRHELRVGGGESYTEVAARFLPFVAALRARWGGTDSAILLVAHGGLYQCVLPLLCPNLDPRFTRAHAPSNAAAIVVAEAGMGWTCVQWGETPMGGQ
jgi:probable phosphoglycerate mutase